jgi:hypothetical protein
LISKFRRLKILKNQKRVGPTCQPQRPLKWLTPVTRARALDTVCSDMTVTIRRQWPTPHVVTALSSRKVEQREVSPISPSSTRMPRHHSALLLSVGASCLRLTPGLNAAFRSSTFTPRCSLTSPPAPLTTPPCSRHQFPSTAIPPCCPTDGSPPLTVPRFSNSSRSVAPMPCTTTTLK